MIFVQLIILYLASKFGEEGGGGISSVINKREKWVFERENTI